METYLEDSASRVKAYTQGVAHGWRLARPGARVEVRYVTTHRNQLTNPAPQSTCPDPLQLAIGPYLGPTPWFEAVLVSEDDEAPSGGSDEMPSATDPSPLLEPPPPSVPNVCTTWWWRRHKSGAHIQYFVDRAEDTRCHIYGLPGARGLASEAAKEPLGTCLGYLHGWGFVHGGY
jgi:hypothetical protein